MALALLLALTQLSTDRDALIKGVDTLIAPGALPGAVVASQSAFVVMRTGDAPTVAAGPVGAGRAMVLGHGGFFGTESLKNPSNMHLFANSLAWLSRRPVKGLRIGMLGSDNVTVGAQSLGADPVSLDRSKFQARLDRIDVLMMGQDVLRGDNAAQQSVVSWVKAGHGLITAGPGWGWQELNAGYSIRTDLAANRMLVPFGLGLSGNFADGVPTSKGADDPLLQTDSALSALKKGGLTEAETTRATAAVSRALNLSSLDNSKLVTEIRQRAIDEGTTKWPITKTMPFTHLYAIVKLRAWQENPPEKVQADPSAALFPGPVAPEARRVARTIEVDTSVPNWHGLGLYAPPGEVIEVALTAGVAKGIAVRIGSHTDTLWDIPEWQRFPEISRRWMLDATNTKVASPFGGTIYIDVPPDCPLGKISVTVDGAVEAPRYVRGKTTQAEWARMLAKPGAPWVDLEAHGVILSVPRSAVVKLSDPEPLMAYWDEVVDLCYAFYGTPRRPRPERYCVDRQISAGYMHAGYPIMTWEDVANTFTDVAKLRGKEVPWGFYHELGHNFQEPAWTFDGTGEVTNNLFSLLGCEHFNGQLHPGGMAVDQRQDRLRKYLAKGAKFSEWKNDPFLALGMYDELREAFGWAVFTQVFNEYRRLGINPKSELAQHDEWMVRMARATHRNLGPFFLAWGVPTSEAARSSISDLPAWMPADWPKT